MKNKKDLEILLEGIDLSAHKKGLSSRHVVTVELIWPRNQVALRSATLTCRLNSGKHDASQLPWHKKIIFKEGVEDRFAIRVKVTESMTEAAFESALRYIGSGIFGAVETALDTGLGGIAGDIASSPFEYGRKQLAKTTIDADVWVEGTIDLDAKELADTQELLIPLLALDALYCTEPPVGDKGGRTKRNKIYAANEKLGEARLTINVN